ncbi:hypothetical protein EON82_04315 [bacterium]|nr:MAG: hypothetical protein EON82_04315 [bacterium]
MRPIVLAGIVAALAGCSIPYEGKKFAAIPKPHHMAEGEHREVADPTDNNEQSGAVHMESHGTGQGGQLYAPDQDDHLGGASGHKSVTRSLGQTPIVFPSTHQPTGQETQNHTENAKAPKPQPAAEEHGHESVQGESEHHGEAAGH